MAAMMSVLLSMTMTAKFSFAYLKEALYVAILAVSKISLMLHPFPGPVPGSNPQGCQKLQ
jgi:hypothetical protein